MKFLMVLLLTVLVLGGCGRRGRPGSQTQGGAGMVKEEKPAAGIEWSHAAAWEKLHDLPMRVVTYVVPSYLEDVDPAECAVFYFGKDQGGTVDENIQRWGSQFEGAADARKSATDVQGINVSIVRISGTYLAPAGPLMQSQGRKTNYKLLGAIVEGPEGMVFFKLTGPSSMVEKSEQDFQDMIESIRKK